MKAEDLTDRWLRVNVPININFADFTSKIMILDPIPSLLTNFQELSFFANFIFSRSKSSIILVNNIEGLVGEQQWPWHKCWVGLALIDCRAVKITLGKCFGLLLRSKLFARFLDVWELYENNWDFFSTLYATLFEWPGDITEVECVIY